MCLIFAKSERKRNLNSRRQISDFFYILFDFYFINIIKISIRKSLMKYQSQKTFEYNYQKPEIIIFTNNLP